MTRQYIELRRQRLLSEKLTNKVIFWPNTKAVKAHAGQSCIRTRGRESSSLVYCWHLQLRTHFPTRGLRCALFQCTRPQEKPRGLLFGDRRSGEQLALPKSFRAPELQTYLSWGSHSKQNSLLQGTRQQVRYTSLQCSYLASRERTDQKPSVQAGFKSTECPTSRQQLTCCSKQKRQFPHPGDAGWVVLPSSVPRLSLAHLSEVCCAQGGVGSCVLPLWKAISHWNNSVPPQGCCQTQHSSDSVCICCLSSEPLWCGHILD